MKLKDELEQHSFYQQGVEVNAVNMMLPCETCISMKDIFDVNYGLILCHIKDGFCSVFISRKGMKKIVKKFMEENLIEKAKVGWKEADKKFEEIINKIINTDLTKLNKNELVSLYGEFFKRDQEVWKLTVFVDAFDPEDLPFEENPVISYTLQQKIDLYEIAKVIKDEFLEEFLVCDDYQSLPKQVVAMIDEHQQKYYWYKNSYANDEFLDQNFFFLELKKIVGLDKLEIEKPNLPSSDSSFKTLAYLREKRKEHLCKAVIINKRFLEEISKRTNILYDLLQFISPWEIEKLLLDKEKMILKLEERKKEVIVMCPDKGGIVFITGEEAGEIHTLLEKEIMGEKSELTGRPACQGVAKGKVKIINKMEEFSKFNKGDILVSSMTRPEFVPLMEKAAAIVTDEGGITCHAAIVSRELGVPCIVGTEIATKVLKDGDLVEVDAEKGIVRKLE